MIKGFETITADLSNDELQMVQSIIKGLKGKQGKDCLLYTSPSPRDS